jgi:hypothetical protein
MTSYFDVHKIVFKKSLKKLHHWNASSNVRMEPKLKTKTNIEMLTAFVSERSTNLTTTKVQLEVDMEIGCYQF